MFPLEARLAECFSVEKMQGYYRVNGRIYFNKTEALLAAGNSGSLTYHFMESAFKSLDWTKEPTESLQELYLRRALQLRDKYDYLILGFSGGSDSYNILRTFTDNGIFLDEVVSTYPVDVADKMQAYWDFKSDDPQGLVLEYLTAAKPALSKLAAETKTKITVIDQIPTTVKLVQSNSLYFLNRSGFAVNPMGAGYYKIAEVARSIEDTGKTAAVIYGADKPRLLFSPSTKMFGLYFDDFSKVFTGFPQEAFSGYAPNTELFYYGLPAITHKQAFVLKRLILSKLSTGSTFKDLYASLTGNNIVSFDVHKNLYKTALYSNWNPSVWQVEKSMNHFYPEAMSFFFQPGFLESKILNSYVGQAVDLSSNLPLRFVEYDSAGRVTKLKPIFSEAIWF